MGKEASLGAAIGYISYPVLLQGGLEAVAMMRWPKRRNLLLQIGGDVGLKIGERSSSVWPVPEGELNFVSGSVLGDVSSLPMGDP